MHSSSSVAVEEHLHGDTCWVAIRARGAEWSWLTPDEAAELGRQWVEIYASVARTNASSFLRWQNSPPR